MNSMDEYDYQLPVEKIAFFPLEKRDQSKLLHYQHGQISRYLFKDIFTLIPENAQLFFNNTRVLPARLFFKTQHGANIEVFYLEPSQQSIHQGLLSKGSIQIKAYVGGAKKWKDPCLQKSIPLDSGELLIQAQKKGIEKDYYLIDLQWNILDLTFADVLQLLGQMPLPPYIKREVQKQDAASYQTVYNQIAGSVAAPTAGLHFTEDLFNALQKKNIRLNYLTLHVGAGTFKPVKDDNIRKHNMHQEYVEIPLEVIEVLAHENLRPRIAIGTTSLRSLESLYWLGLEIIKNPSNPTLHVSQWIYENTSSPKSCQEVMKYLLAWMKEKKMNKLCFDTQILIQPGYTFQVMDALITNFHQPKSTLLLLVSAFIGKDWKNVYHYALENEFRFLSYGDSSLLWKKEYNTR